MDPTDQSRPDGAERPLRSPSRRPGTAPWQARQTLLVALAAMFGVLLGIGGFTFRYAEGLSYLSTDPKACVNCHIMRSQYDGWQKSSHHAAAVCIDCHLPHEFVPKYLAKMENGYRHSKEFTAQTFAEPIFVKARGQQILQENCLRCHGGLVEELTWNAHAENRQVSCVRCHAGVGHGEPARLGGRLLARDLEGTK